MNREEIFAGVKDCLEECVRVEPDEITLKSTIIDDLGADSLDLLDIVFSLERQFDVKIKQGEVEKIAREGIPEDEFEKNKKLLPKGAERLREILSEVPAEKIHEGLNISQLPYLFNVETFVKIIERSLNSKENGEN